MEIEEEADLFKSEELTSYTNLKEAVLVAINSNKPLKLSNKMKCLSSDLEKIKTFTAATQKQIHDKTFRPLKFTDSRGSRMFSLLSSYDCKAKSVQIDQQAFWKIVNTCGKTNQEIKDSITKEKNDGTFRSCYSQIFDFSKLGFKNKQDLSNDKRLFWDYGYSVEFTLKKKPAKKSTSKPLTAADFCEDIKNDQVLI
ncbi:hypothetical protein [Parasitella parasitica]|uniref:Uncharacterized protein n=1 Tax=Parasitella parasitica TaxID=35722 RepID=A0A0B7NAF8_9FUNG|nr:hypothetical protein [Parasitella parasitica]